MSDPIEILWGSTSIEPLHVALDWVRDGHGDDRRAELLVELATYDLDDRQLVVAWRHIRQSEEPGGPLDWLVAPPAMAVGSAVSHADRALIAACAWGAAAQGATGTHDDGSDAVWDLLCRDAAASASVAGAVERLGKHESAATYRASLSAAADADGLRPELQADGWSVVDPAGGRWWPTEDEASYILASHDPAGTSLEICRSGGGAWHQ